MFVVTPNVILDFLLPRFCASCNFKLESKEKVICEKCSSTLEYATSNLITHEFKRKFRNENLISDFASVYVFRESSPLKNIIHELKYEQRFQIGKFLGIRIAEKLQTQILDWNANLLIPIPLHKLRKVERGFNQANEIAKGISKITKIPVESKSLRRSKFTETQTHLNLNERKENIKGAFKLKNSKMIKNKRIILVDDVITTGATTSESAKILLENGAEKVYAISVAIAE